MFIKNSRMLDKMQNEQLHKGTLHHIYLESSSGGTMRLAAHLVLVRMKCKYGRLIGRNSLKAWDRREDNKICSKERDYKHVTDSSGLG
jgi:hypothetical protein